MTDERELSTVANAIGFALFKNSREVMMLNGVESVEVSPVEAQNIRFIAAEAIKALDAYRETQGKQRSLRKRKSDRSTRSEA